MAATGPITATSKSPTIAIIVILSHGGNLSLFGASPPGGRCRLQAAGTDLIATAKNHPDRALAQRRWVCLYRLLDGLRGPLLSNVGASGDPGAVHWDVVGCGCRVGNRIASRSPTEDRHHRILHGLGDAVLDIEAGTVTGRVKDALLIEKPDQLYAADRVVDVLRQRLCRLQHGHG